MDSRRVKSAHITIDVPVRNALESPRREKGSLTALITTISEGFCSFLPPEK